jgi:hypothetical protein
MGYMMVLQLGPFHNNTAATTAKEAAFLWFRPGRLWKVASPFEATL